MAQRVWLCKQELARDQVDSLEEREALRRTCEISLPAEVQDSITKARGSLLVGHCNNNQHSLRWKFTHGGSTDRCLSHLHCLHAESVRILLQQYSEGYERVTSHRKYRAAPASPDQAARLLGYFDS